MKLTTFTHDRQQKIGAVIADESLVVDLEAADRRAARREKRERADFFGDMLGFFDAGGKALRLAKQLVREVDDGKAKADGRITHRLRSVRIGAPMPNPRKIFCLAGNFADHVAESVAKLGVKRPTPRVFMKPPSNTVIAPGSPILLPPVTNAIDWEGELAVVMGRKAKGVKAKQALRYVGGYTIMNDVSERKLNLKRRKAYAAFDEFFDWLNGKWLDSFAPQGPWIVTSDEIRDPQTLDISTYVNGDRKQHNNTRQMLSTVARTIEYISEIITLEPGDLISTGTISGVGAASGTFMKPGDKVEIRISRIGSLKNPVRKSAK
ncbi:MAG: 5-carboxymethyl-2-hydroxymuconate isomerase [Phycisphaeraceae bacterium]|nr:5-carboxymethyl-2-hydroxymuconate isomerase [Phycisphaeraceae bacterium]